MEKQTHKLGMRLELTPSTISQIYQYLGQHPAERGGILGCDANGIICHFHADITADCTSSEYTPDVDRLNEVIQQWRRQNIQFRGFVHSHPFGCRELSSADKDYARAILREFRSLPYLALPLVMTSPDSDKFELIPYIAELDNSDGIWIQEAGIAISETAVGVRDAEEALCSKEVNNCQPKDSSSPSAWLPRRVGRISYFGRFTSLAHKLFHSLGCWGSGSTALNNKFLREELTAARTDDEKATAYFQRVQTGYDLPLLNSTRLILIGTGGGWGLACDCARAGFAEFILVDPGSIEEANVGSQSVDPDRIGAPKVDALAAEIRRLNPKSAVVAIRAGIESLSDEDFGVLLSTPIRATRRLSISQNKRQARKTKVLLEPEGTILLVCTDSFTAQARGHRLGLHFGLPTICAQEYREGRGAEVTFTVPGVTPACHRCITAARYRAYLSEGYKNDVTSVGAPIFAAQMLNAVIGHIVLAVAHHGTGHPRFGGLIGKFGKRNLLLLRMDPDFDAFMGWPAFERPLTNALDPHAFMMLDSVFLPQSPDCGQSETRPICPDCGGTGDLRACIGKFPDTRLMRRKPSSTLLKWANRRLRSLGLGS